MKVILLLTPVLLLIVNNTRSQPIVLNPDSIDSFVLDPADFDTDKNSGSIWIPAPFGKKDPTTYQKGQRENGSAIITASSNNSISSVKVEIEADATDFPIIEWDWRIESVLESGDVNKKDGDDYPARIYITFDYPVSNFGFGDRIKYRLYKTFTSFDVPTRALNYIWANKADLGTIHPNPFTNWIKMVVVQSGNEKAGSWQHEEHNILEDYRKAFGEEPPAITGIQIMTDSDNTGESAEAAYGKIILRKKTVPDNMDH